MANGLSLHVGLNRVDPKHYAGWSGPLTACEADAEDMNTLAQREKYDATLLLTDEATRKAVTDGIRGAAKSLRAGDIFFLSYSGHGGQIPDTGGEESDLKDETWCLYDGELIDDELRELWAQFREDVRILLLSDSCHSGSVSRMAYDEIAGAGLARGRASRVGGDRPPVYRAAPDEVSLRTYRANRDFYTEIMRSLPPPGKESPIRATVRLISGCQDNQLSQDGTFNGLFTGTLLRVWKDGAFEGTYRRFHRAILRLMPPTQSPNHLVIGLPDSEYDAQRPFSI